MYSGSFALLYHRQDTNYQQNNELHLTPIYMGTRWSSWLRHCATSGKVAGSIPDGVIGNFSLT